MYMFRSSKGGPQTEHIIHRFYIDFLRVWEEAAEKIKSYVLLNVKNNYSIMLTEKHSKEEKTGADRQSRMNGKSARAIFRGGWFRARTSGKGAICLNDMAFSAISIPNPYWVFGIYVLIANCFVLYQQNIIYEG